MGRSGGGIRRPGFERLLAEICEGRVGAVFAIEASRLARNGRDWHTLIEFCGLVGTIHRSTRTGPTIRATPTTVWSLGMKGTMSELELSLIRQRSQEALKQKARRGALFLNVAAGYVKTGHDRIEKDPDQRVQDALRLVFTKFADLQSIRQVYVWFREEGIELPIKSGAEEARGLVWKLPIYNAVRNILTNPVYAGAYAFGRTKSKVLVDNGRKLVRRGVRRSPTEWDVLIKDQHEGYITWEEFEKESARDCRQRDRKGQRHRARSGKERRTPSRWAVQMRSLRPEDARELRLGQPLPVQHRHREEPCQQAVHLRCRYLSGSGGRRGSSAHPEATRWRRRCQGARGPERRNIRGSAAV